MQNDKYITFISSRLCRIEYDSLEVSRIIAAIYSICNVITTSKVISDSTTR